MGYQDIASLRGIGLYGLYQDHLVLSKLQVLHVLPPPDPSQLQRHGMKRLQTGDLDVAHTVLGHTLRLIMQILVIRRIRNANNIY